MNDIEIARQISPEVGLHYEQGRANSRVLSEHSLKCFRSLASVICHYLDNRLSLTMKLDDNIHAIKTSRLLKTPDIYRLHVLRLNGNKGVHSEACPETDFLRLASESEKAALDLIKTLYKLDTGEDSTDLEIADVASNELQRICYKAMFEQDVDAMCVNR
jgi:hypothetical protein